jgi:DnaJ-class molecular chaperone
MYDQAPSVCPACEGYGEVKKDGSAITNPKTVDRKVCRKCRGEGVLVNGKPIPEEVGK